MPPSSFMLLGVCATLSLAFTSSRQRLLLFYIIGTLGFNGSNVYYDSFLPDVTTEERMDQISALGYGLGYIGGSPLPLIVSLLLIQFGSVIGIPTILATRISFVLTAVWWLTLSLAAAL